LSEKLNFHQEKQIEPPIVRRHCRVCGTDTSHMNFETYLECVRCNCTIQKITEQQAKEIILSCPIVQRFLTKEGIEFV